MTHRNTQAPLSFHDSLHLLSHQDAFHPQTSLGKGHAPFFVSLKWLGLMAALPPPFLALGNRSSIFHSPEHIFCNQRSSFPAGLLLLLRVFLLSLDWNPELSVSDCFQGSLPPPPYLPTNLHDMTPSLNSKWMVTEVLMCACRYGPWSPSACSA